MFSRHPSVFDARIKKTSLSRNLHIFPDLILSKRLLSLQGHLPKVAKQAILHHLALPIVILIILFELAI